MNYNLEEVASGLAHLKDILAMMAEQLDASHDSAQKMSLYNNAFKIDEIATNLKHHVHCGINPQVVFSDI